MPPGCRDRSVSGCAKSPLQCLLLKPVLAFADFEYDFGRGWAVFETVGVTPSDFDDRFTVPHTRPALQQQVHTALRDAAAVSAVRPLQQGGCGRKPAVLIVFECLIVEVLCGFDGMCGCAAAFGIEVMLFQFAVVEFWTYVLPEGCIFVCSNALTFPFNISTSFDSRTILPSR